jgi:hypothetical protein
MLPATVIRDAAYAACREYMLTPPFTTKQFRRALEDERELYIEMRPQIMPDGSFGLCVAESKKQYVILYHRLSSLLHREATIWHELGHIFFDHVTPRKNRLYPRSAPGAGFIDTVEDYEAELFARTMLRYALGHNMQGYDHSLAAQQRDPQRASQLKQFLDELAHR